MQSSLVEQQTIKHLLSNKQDASEFKKPNLNMHYLKLDLVFSVVWLK